MRKVIWIVFSCLLIACTPVEEELVVLPTETSTAIPTETPVWFPPTETPSPLPTIEIVPTEDIRPHSGREILVETFSSPFSWNEVNSVGSNVKVVDGGINFVLSHPFGFLYSYRTSPVVADFYLEVTANTSICKDDSQYGILFRASPAPSFYRLEINCAGEASVTLVLPDSAHLVVPWQKIGVISGITPGTVRLGIWAKGSEVRFFANDFYMFSIERAQLYSGSIGLFVRTLQSDAVSVQYKDLIIYEVNP